jgi:two-component system, LytTR family, sensor histidine kinase AgrC
MDTWQKLIVSFVPVVVETAILQELYIALYRSRVEVRDRVLYGLLFVVLIYPIVYLGDNAFFPEGFGIARSILVFVLYAMMLRVVFKGGFFAKCLPATAVFVFLSIVIETVMWFFARKLGLDIFVIRHTFWMVLTFQAILFSLEFMFVLLLKNMKAAVGLSLETSKKIWLPTAGYLIVISLFWIGLIQQLNMQLRTGALRTVDVIGIIACLLVSLSFVKGSMDITREIETREREIEGHKAEINYQKLFNSGMEAMLFELSRFQHNYNNTLAALKGYAESGDTATLRQYIDDLCRKNNISFSLNRTALASLKNSAAAGIIAAKMFKAETMGIDFRLTVADNLESVNMKTAEFCEALGILLDNSLEAAAESAAKYVKVNIHRKENGTVIDIENSVNKKPDIHMMFQKGYTSKPGGVGIGLYILEKILGKYDNVFLNTLADDQQITQELCII